MKPTKLGPFMVRQWSASASINDAWFYLDRRGLMVVAETASTPEGSPRKQHIVGIIPWAQVRRAMRVRDGSRHLFDDDGE